MISKIRFFSKLGGVIDDFIEIISTSNPLNQTCAYFISSPNSNSAVDNIDSAYAFPGTKTPLINNRTDFVYSMDSMLAYPILANIPILIFDLAIVACHPEKYSELPKWWSR